MLPAAARAASRAAPPLSPQQIFAKAQDVLRSQSYPPFVSYVTDVQSQADGKHYEEEFQSWLRTADGAQATVNEPIATTNKPINPYGFDINFFGIQLNPKQGIETPFGIPQMTPIYTFGMAERRPAQGGPSPKPDDVYTPSIPYRQLGRITVTPRDYRITLVGRERAENHSFYHLRLEPLSDPGERRLRDLWIDEQNFKVWRLRTAGLFAQGPPARALWEIEYRLIDGYLFIQTERTGASFRLGGLIGAKVTTYAGITYTFRDIYFPQEPPKYVFEGLTASGARQPW